MVIILFYTEGFLSPSFQVPKGLSLTPLKIILFCEVETGYMQYGPIKESGNITKCIMFFPFSVGYVCFTPPCHNKIYCVLTYFYIWFESAFRSLSEPNLCLFVAKQTRILRTIQTPKYYLSHSHPCLNAPTLWPSLQSCPTS